MGAARKVRTGLTAMGGRNSGRPSAKERAKAEAVAPSLTVAN